MPVNLRKSIIYFIIAFTVLNGLALIPSVSNGLTQVYLKIYQMAYQTMFKAAELEITRDRDELVFQFFNRQMALDALKIAKSEGNKGVEVKRKKFNFKPNYYISFTLIFMWSLILAGPISLLQKIKYMGLGSLIFFVLFSLGFITMIRQRMASADIGLFEDQGFGSGLLDFVARLFDSLGFLSFLIIAILALFFYKKTRRLDS